MKPSASGGYPAYLRRTLGLWVEEWFPLGTEEKRTIRFAGKKPIPVTQWSEVIHLEKAKALAKYAECHLLGRPAVTENRLGKGRAFYLGTRLQDRDLAELLDCISQQAGTQSDFGGARGRRGQPFGKNQGNGFFS